MPFDMTQLGLSVVAALGGQVYRMSGSYLAIASTQAGKRTHSELCLLVTLSAGALAVSKLAWFSSKSCA
jgi:hypothetical protein